MSTTAYVRRTGAVMPVAKPRPTLDEIVRRIRALRALHKSTGFSQNRTIGEMLEGLSQEDLIKIGEAFLQTPLVLHDSD